MPRIWSIKETEKNSNEEENLSIENCKSGYNSRRKIAVFYYYAYIGMALKNWN